MSHASDTGFVTTTVANREEARQIARTLLAERLAACVQLVEIESHYIWKGEEKAEPEVMLLIKTRADLFDPRSTASGGCIPTRRRRSWPRLSAPALRPILPGSWKAPAERRQQKAKIDAI